MVKYTFHNSVATKHFLFLSLEQQSPNWREKHPWHEWHFRSARDTTKDLDLTPEVFAVSRIQDVLPQHGL